MSEINKKSECIAAIATPHGKGAIGCIRLSGEGSIALVYALTKGLPQKAEYGKMRVCTFDGRVKDKIMVVVYADGKSYTGEESAELYFHGGKFLVEQALLSVLDAGARLAGPGEFTQRAFLNGKIDLTQAEGIGDLIDADSIAAANEAYGQSEGKTRAAIEKLYEQAVKIAAQAEVSIDYPEEDIEELTREQTEQSIADLQKNIRAQIQGYNGGRIRREGARVVLTGKVNAGKSTLFNTLLGQERAIVSDEAGTTRDTIEEKIRYRDVAFVLVDTAGLRQTDSKVEQMGIERSIAAKRDADITVQVTVRKDTASESLDENTVLVVNSFQPMEKGEKTLFADGKTACIVLNAKTGTGIELLEEELYLRAAGMSERAGNINNPRQYAALCDADDCLSRAQTALRTLTMDCVCADLCAAVDALGRIIGKTASESVVDEIFSHFCVGK